MSFVFFLLLRATEFAPQANAVLMMSYCRAELMTKRRTHSTSRWPRHSASASTANPSAPASLEPLSGTLCAPVGASPVWAVVPTWASGTILGATLRRLTVSEASVGIDEGEKKKLNPKTQQHHALY
ncbi:hypothetical protein FRC08_010895 [Ceratobasidium sp. 394]|nr:hypothetical protein FRC08_010895 [Ceratobasidium sp. 394]